MKSPSLESQALVGVGRRNVIVTPSGELIAADMGITADLNSVTSAATSKSTLKAAVLPAGILAQVRGLRITAWGTAKATANNKTQTIDIATVTFATTGAVANNGGNWKLELLILKKSTDVQEAICQAISQTTVLALRSAGSLTEANALLVEITSTNVTDTDGTICTGFVVEPVY